MTTSPDHLDPEALLAQTVWLGALARRLVGQQAEADDLVQTSLLAALEHPPRLVTPRAWLARVMRNAACSAGQTEAAVSTQAGAITRWDPRLERGLHIRGRVVTDAGSPLAGWSVVAGDPNSGMAHTTSGAQGEFEVGPLPAGLHEVGAREGADWYAVPQVVASHVPAGASDVVLRVAAREQSAFLAGTVLGNSLEPLPDAQVTVFRLDWNAGTSHPAEVATGRFRIGPLAAGSYRLWIDASRHPRLELGPVALEGGKTHDFGTIVLPRGGRLLATPGESGGDRQIASEILAPGVRSPLPYRVIARDGLLQSDLLPPGEYLLRLHGPTIATALVPFTITDGEDTRATVSFLETHPGRARRLAIVTRDARGNVLEDTEYERASCFPWDYSVRLLPGTYVVEASTDTGGHATATLSIGADERPVEMTVTLVE